LRLRHTPRAPKILLPGGARAPAKR
jgi:hypothetical protein